MRLPGRVVNFEYRFTNSIFGSIRYSDDAAGAIQSLAPHMPTSRPLRRRVARTQADAASLTSVDPNYMLSLARGLAVIQAFSAERPKLSVAEASRVTGFSRAATRRCLHTLKKLGYASGENGVFELTPHVLTLGYAYLGSAPLARYAQPVLERLAQDLHESCSLTILDGDEIVYVARAATRRILSIGLSVGSRLPAYCTSMGRVLLAWQLDGEIAAFVERVQLKPQTRYTITSRSALRAELRRVRAAGFSIVDQELEIGLRSIAVPVLSPAGEAMAALNCGMQTVRAEPKVMARDFLPALRAAADEIAIAIVHLR
jgi:IclR family transcriptional regulator, pca regulon regulatory protein